MLDKRCFAILSLIIKECNGTGYKLFSIPDLVSLLPVRLGLETEGIREAILSLSDHELISVKYFDDNEICLRPLIKGRVAIENITEKEFTETSLKRKLFVFSFFGGLLGALISSLAFYLLAILGGGYAF